MTSIIKLEALSGVYDDSPLCYLLQVDEFHFLLDCGWDECFHMGYIEHVKKNIPKIDAVLLSYADVPHLGALPYLVGKCGLNCPVYATVPVFKMGQMFMYDWYLAHNNVEDFTMFSLDDVDAAFDKVQQVKYSQNVSLKGRGHGLQITPIAAGHMIGGTIWRITKAGEEEIVYAVDFNHKKERHLNGCQWELFGRPNLLITDCYSALYEQARRKDRDTELLKNIIDTLRQGGNVLIVIDTAGRVLELAQLLDTVWHQTEAGLISYSLVMMSNIVHNVVEFAKSQVEWMSDKILKSFQEGRFNPFQFRHIQLATSMSELSRIRSPKVVLTSHPDMESGFSRELFLEWCGNHKNSVILTSRAQRGTLGHTLLKNLETKTRHVILEIKRRVRLEGAELDEFYRKKMEVEAEAARIRLDAKRRSSRKQSHAMEVDDAGDSSDEDDAALYGPTIEQQKPSVGSAPPTPQISHHDILMRFELQRQSSFFKQPKKQFPMYPFLEEKLKWDEYGEIINPEEYMIIDAPVPGRALVKHDDSDEPVVIYPDSEIPTKCVKFVDQIQVNCQVSFIEFEGRCDGESVKKILAQVKPKQLIIVHGSPEATKFLTDYCRNTSGIVSGRVFSPMLYETVDATIESHIYQVTITDVLMSSLEFQPVKDAELAWVDAKIAIRQDQQIEGGSKITIAKKEDPIKGGKVSEDLGVPVLDHIAAGAEQPVHQAVFVNDPKLSDLKQTLRLNGFHAEFAGGVLFVNNVVSIKRGEAGRLHFEGSACQDYYRIRDVLYRQFAIV